MAATSSASSSSSRAPEKETDITIYGATSFVAKHILRYLLKVAETELTAQANQKLRITLGGRSKAKLEAVQKSFSDARGRDDDSSAETIRDVVVADGSDLEGLKKMAERSRVILNCAGPYFLYSSLVVQACAEVGCDYVDITGEIGWAADMRAKHGAASKVSGARIVSLCGYDSIPSDMSVFCAVQALKRGIAASDMQVHNARLWHQAFGMPNGGTITTFCQLPYNPIDDFTLPKSGDISSSSSPGRLALRPVPFFVGDPLSLSNPEKVVQNPEFLLTKNRMAKSEWMNQLLSVEPDFFYGISLPFAMSAVNTKVIQASAVALGYGHDFTVEERFLPLGYFYTKLASIFALFPMAVMQFCVLLVAGILRIPGVGQKVADALVPPGSGVPDALCARGSNAVYVKMGATTLGDGKSYTAYSYLSFQGDAGNTVTAQCVSEAALVLVFDRDSLPPRSDDGFGTPAEILGEPLLKRFQEAKVRPVTVKASIDAPIL